MRNGLAMRWNTCVALRKESVDRNRTPHHKNTRPIPSLSARRAWIEIPAGCWRDARRVSLSARRAWIEMLLLALTSRKIGSLSARRAWIEIMDDFEPSKTRKVALRKESVDRNPLDDVAHGGPIVSLSARRAWIEIPAGCWRDARRAVALRKESVDRNLAVWAVEHAYQVALRKESVDRNFCAKSLLQSMRVSLSARRAWIEITVVATLATLVTVALRKESVDRNGSLLHCLSILHVALRKESVDRNFYYSDRDVDWVRRSPQGERG